MKTINVTVDENGGVEIEAVGFKGHSCEQATAALEKALGMKTKSIKKPEYRQEEKRRVSN
jgi:hypothetical protein